MSRKIYRVKARPLIDSLRALYAAGARLPAFTVSDVRVALDPSSGRLYARHGERPLGEIHISGIYKPHERASPTDIAAVQKLIEEPTAVARMTARLYQESGVQPRCAVCRIPLGTKADRSRGIGLKCFLKGGFDKFEKRITVVRTSSSKIDRPRRTRLKPKHRRPRNG